jgi:hypothetical protein
MSASQIWRGCVCTRCQHAMARVGGTVEVVDQAPAGHLEFISPVGLRETVEQYNPNALPSLDARLARYAEVWKNKT